MKCARSECSAQATDSFLCSFHSWELGDIEKERRYRDARDRAALFRDVPSGIPLDDDWRNGVIARSRLPYPHRLFCLDTTSWKRMAPGIGAARRYRSATSDYYNDGLLPIEFRLAHVELKDAVDQVLQTLSLREQIVIRMIYGIPGFARHESGETLMVDTEELQQHEVAEKLGWSRSRVSQIEAKALRKLRQPSRSGLLKPFLPWLCRLLG